MTWYAISDTTRCVEDTERGALQTAARMDQAGMSGVRVARGCPGLPGNPDCHEPADAGDRYCAGCRAEFDARPEVDW